MATTMHLRTSAASAWRLRLGPSGVCHLGMLAACAGYLAASYPGCAAVMPPILAAALATELAPARWRRLLLGEALLVLVAGAQWMWQVQPGDAAFQGWVRLLIAYWLLIPAREAMLRWTLSLCVAELLVLGARGGAWWQAGILATLGVGSLALDGWLRGIQRANGRASAGAPRWTGLLRWGAVPALAALAVGAALAPGFLAVPGPMTGTEPTAPIGTTGPSFRILLGDHQGVASEPRISARMLWPEEGRPLLSGPVYLRRIALPQLRLDGRFIVWDGGPPSFRPVPVRSIDESRPYAWIYQAVGGSDVVLAPSPGGAPEIESAWRDAEGNLFVKGLADQARIYRVQLAAREPEQIDDPKRYLQLPWQLMSGATTTQPWPWGQIEDPAWRRMPSDRAAQEIARMLNARCRYAVSGLPTAWPQDGGALGVFLFGSPSERIGHCQFFASAAAVLLRRAGHPARCVIGYASTEQDEAGYTFRNLHAHAWIEIAGEGGVWQRIDPTPPEVLVTPTNPGDDDERIPTPGSEEFRNAVARNAAAAAPTAARTRRWPWVVGSAIALAGAIGLATWLRRRRGASRIDPQRRELDRQAESLHRLALSLGMPVGPNTTLTAIAEHLEQRSGIDLAPHLAAHLAARFGGGPMPPPWPVEEIRSAARASARDEALTPA